MRDWHNLIRSTALTLCVALPAITAAAPADPIHLGVASCASTTCHGSAKPLDGTAVLQNEYVTWSTFDPHSRSCAVLRDDRSREMARRLGLGKPWEEKDCLACHAEVVPAASRGPRFQLSDGVGCEACHGAAARWIDTHYQSPAITHADNVHRGLTPLDEPATRAATCAACHVGGADRVATHAMMAAGHPRLSFELDTFTELWRTSGGREHFRRDGDYARRKAVPDSVNVWLVGLAGSGRRQLAMAASESTAGSMLPEFALFNCYSCHRAMKLERWRGTEADGAATPGSPRLNVTSLSLLATALGALDPAEGAALRGDITKLQAAVPKGGPALRAAATAMLPGLDDLEARLAKRMISAADQRRMLESVVAASGRGEYPDYAAAEQAAMGVTVLVAGSGRGDALQPAIDALFRDLASDGNYDPERFDRVLARFGK